MNGRPILANAIGIPAGLMQRISNENDILCRTVGRCVFGAEIDREIGSLIRQDQNNLGRRFLYARYDPELSDVGLNLMGLSHLTGRQFAMDDVSQLHTLRDIGRTYSKQVDIFRDFPTFLLPLPNSAAKKSASTSP